LVSQAVLENSSPCDPDEDPVIESHEPEPTEVSLAFTTVSDERGVRPDSVVAQATGDDAASRIPHRPYADTIHDGGVGEQIEFGQHSDEDATPVVAQMTTEPCEARDSEPWHGADGPDGNTQEGSDDVDCAREGESTNSDVSELGEHTDVTRAPSWDDSSEQSQTLSIVTIVSGDVDHVLARLRSRAESIHGLGPDGAALARLRKRADG